MIDDSRLWREAVAGRTDAFGELFVRHARPIFDYCLRRTGSWSSAEDLTSAVFLEAWRRRTSSAPTGPSALPWLYTIALGLTRNHRRSLRRYHDAMAKLHVARPAADHAETVTEHVDAERRAQQVLRELAKLPRTEQEVIQAIAWMELTHAEAAELLQIPVGTVKSRLARAHRKLRSLVVSSASA